MPRRGENIYHRRDGRWEGRYIARRDENGKAIYRSLYGRCYCEVKTKLNRAKQSNQSNKASLCNRVNDLFYEWLNAIRGQIKASTLANYRMKLEKHLLPEFGQLSYDRITAPLIQQFILKKMNTGLSAKYVADIVVVFKSMAKYMERVHGYPNPLVHVILPKADKSERFLLNAEQQKTLIGLLFSMKSRTALVVLLSLFCGLRIGEVCGLKHSDLDEKTGFLTVRRTVQRIRSDSCRTELHIGSPKSKSSFRIVPVPRFLLELLAKYRENVDYYLLSGTANPTDPRTLQNRFHSILKKAGLPSVSYHCLRHMFASNCLAAGADVKTLSEILGHASAETTLNRYVHTSADRKIVCMEQLCKAQFPSGIWSESGGNRIGTGEIRE